MNQTSNDAQLHGLEHVRAAGRSLIQVQTSEEDRLGRLLTQLAQREDKPLWTWQINTGLMIGNTPVTDTHTAEAALAHLREVSQPVFVWFKDLHHHYTPTVIRALRDIYYRWRDEGSALFISAPEQAIPHDLEREMAFLPLTLPSTAELAAEVAAWRERSQRDWSLKDEQITATLKGLTLAESRHSLHRADRQAQDETQLLRLLQEEKRQLIAKLGTLEYIPDVPPIQELGGLENLKEWLDKRKDLLLSVDESLADIVPKGVLLMGVSGCGKSLVTKAISSAWSLPLYRMEMSRIFSGAGGSPEIAFSEACRTMEAMAPAVLWIDEIEMSLSAEGSAAADTTLSRIFAFFLTWMQEKPPGLFVTATANRIDLLPAEMIRKGRFDQVFFVDLPNRSEREQIFAIHLKKRGYDPAQFTPEVFADAAENWNGAEIEQCVIAAVTAAKMEQRELTIKDLYAARKQIVPIATTMEEQVRHIRNWAYERAVRASAED